MEADGTITLMADRWDGKRLHRPNDIVCRLRRKHIFTNPSGRVPPKSRRSSSRASSSASLRTARCPLKQPTSITPTGWDSHPMNRSCYVSNTRALGEPADQYWGGQIKQNQYIRAYDVAARRFAQQQPGVCQHGVRRGWRARRHEGRQRGPRLLHRFRRRVGLRARRGTPGHNQAAGNPRQLRVRRPRISKLCSSPHAPRYTACASPRPALRCPAPDASGFRRCASLMSS